MREINATFSLTNEVHRSCSPTQHSSFQFLSIRFNSIQTPQYFTNTILIFSYIDRGFFKLSADCKRLYLNKDCQMWEINATHGLTMRYTDAGVQHSIRGFKSNSVQSKVDSMKNKHWNENTARSPNITSVQTSVNVTINSHWNNTNVYGSCYCSVAKSFHTSSNEGLYVSDECVDIRVFVLASSPARLAGSVSATNQL